MSAPKTALLIPCYNAERYLENLRAQVDALNPAFDELIIVDDGSTDATVAKARETGFNIRALGKNRGPGGARNALWQMATAEWVHFLDADDEIAPDYLAKVMPWANETVDVVLSTTLFVDEVSRGLVKRWEFADEEFRTNPLRAAVLYPVPLHSSFIRSEALRKTDGFDEELRCWEDGDLHVRLAAAGARFRCIPDILAWSPRHQRGAGGDSLYCWRCRLKFLRRYADFTPRISRQDLCSECVVAARGLCADNDWRSANEALDLASDFGWEGPKSQNSLLRLLAKIPSRAVRNRLFSLQTRARTRAVRGAKTSCCG